jgi:hypothetical protein
VGLGNLFGALLRFFQLVCMNYFLFPIDGGHALFTIVEMATGKL